MDARLDWEAYLSYFVSSQTSILADSVEEERREKKEEKEVLNTPEGRKESD